MAREVRRKNLDEDFQLNDSFDDSLFETLDKMDQETGFDSTLDSTMSGMAENSDLSDTMVSSSLSSLSDDDFTDTDAGSGPKSSDRKNLLVLEKKEKGGAGGAGAFSLDELEGFGDDDFQVPDLSDLPDMTEGVESKTETEPPADERPEDGVQPSPGRVMLPKIIMMVVAGCLVAGGVAFLAWKMVNKPSKIQVVTVIKRPISIPRHEEVYEFLILASSQKERDLVSMGLEFEFVGLKMPDFFKNDPLLLRDTVYRFLLEQKPAKNSVNSWQKIIEKDLFSHLQSVLPGSRISSIRIKHLDRL